MLTSTYASLKTNLIIKMTECQQSVSLPTRILKVPSVAPVIIWGTAIGSWCVTPPDARYKSGSSFASSRTTWTPSASTEGPQSQQDEGSAVHSCPWSACCQSRGSSWRHLTGTRGIWTVVQAWEEVLAYIHVSVPFEVWSCGRLSLAMSLQLRIAPFTGSIPAVCDVCIISTIHSLALMHVQYSCKTEGRSHSCWIRAVAFDKIA